MAWPGEDRNFLEYRVILSALGLKRAGYLNGKKRATLKWFAFYTKLSDCGVFGVKIFSISCPTKLMRDP